MQKDDMDTATKIAIVQTGANIVLVVVTMYYVWLTWRIVRETKDSRELSAAPIVRCDLKVGESLTGPPAKPAWVSKENDIFDTRPPSMEELIEAQTELINWTTGWLSHHVLYLSNIGDGVALNITWQLKLESGGGSAITSFTDKGELDALAARTDPGQPIELEAKVTPTISDEQYYPVVTILVSYSNIYERAFATRAQFAFQKVKSQNPGDWVPQYTWIKVNQFTAIDRKGGGQRRWLK